MQNQNLENDSDQIKRNPTRNNTNSTRGGNETSSNDQSSEVRDKNLATAQFDFDEDDLGDSGVDDSSINETHQFNGGPEAGDYDNDEFGNITESQKVEKNSSPTRGSLQKKQQ